MEILFHSHLDSNRVIATKVRTWHDSCAVVACVNFCCDLMASNEITARRISIEFELRAKNTLWNGLLVHIILSRKCTTQETTNKRPVHNWWPSSSFKSICYQYFSPDNLNPFPNICKRKNDITLAVTCLWWQGALYENICYILENI